MKKNILKTWLKRVVNNILDDVLFVDSRNIERARQRQALREAVLFVEEHMP